MRALIIGTFETFEVIAEEFKIPGTDERFVVHPTRDVYRSEFVATHLDTGQVIAEGETIDEAIAKGTAKWLSVPPEIREQKLAERRAWATEKVKERATPP